MYKQLTLYTLSALLLLTAACTGTSTDIDDSERTGSNATTQPNAILGECDTNRAAVSSYLFTERIKLWRYTSTTYWCYDGTLITSEPAFTTEARIYGIANHFYSYEGNLTTSESGGLGGLSYTDYTEGQFAFGLPEYTAFSSVGFALRLVEYELDLLDLPLSATAILQFRIVPDPELLEWYPSIWKYQYADGSHSNETDRDEE
ncbi:MAG: hypothetical protein OXD31_18005 [Chloroflexi bacterium]|nr:hypothetical protein [Chloroflexota bacterium]